ncbi:deoxyribodipyrimidine photo-lyase [Acetobacter sp. DsW_063]|uniref:cryptochrome/photolyase family protein n=1 Tax=Acetobacter sp. DsW_063 TaxID=1514894 RepID=UPI000A3B1A3D|nr:deoxyribodipyrimidine photo-lyase [Acetobacter sp. DsW_063]OUJ15205.1 deoxyribodipyrimidine photolyase [Acetobacter sp. DsW_063]
MNDKPAIVWLREDFRLADNAALTAATQTGAPLLLVHIRPERPSGMTAVDWFREKTLAHFNAGLQSLSGKVHVFTGDSARLLPEIVARIGAAAVFWNRRYDPIGREIDAGLKREFAACGTEAHSFAGALFHEPWTVKNRAGQPFKIFSAYWRAACEAGSPGPPLPAPREFKFFAGSITGAQEQQLSWPAWTSSLDAYHEFGEAAAQDRLARFVADDLGHYEDERDFPDRDATSGLSPYLRVGQITPRQVWNAVSDAPGGLAHAAARAKFLAELGWRDFAWSVLWEHPGLADHALREEFEDLPWRSDPSGLEAWKRGRTGYPLVDAGMRELWRSGVMHNRVRMVAASFLVKHLLIDWRLGEQWFAETLVDYDPASNALNWQWCAGTGADSAPFFRIMNPVLQSRKFDPSGAYIRRWVPELKSASDKHIHAPWESPDARPANYPLPIVDHAAARRRALAAWDGVRGGDRQS